MKLLFILIIVYQLLGFIGSIYLLGASGFAEKWSFNSFKRNLFKNKVDWFIWIIVSSTVMPILMLFHLKTRVLLAMGRNEYTGRKIIKRSKLE